MSTTAASRRAERTFFVAATLCLGAFVLIGFWRSYFHPGVFTASLPSLLVHVHGALMVGWIVLVMCQVGLIASRKVRWHQRLGTAIAFWAAAIVIIGPPTAVLALRRPGSGVDGMVLFGDFAMILAFAILVALALLRRRTSAEHKRLMLLATATLMLPPLVRWPFAFMHDGPPIGTVGLYFAVPLALVIYDLFTLRRVHRATLLGAALMVVIVGTTLTVPSTAWWKGITSKVQHPPPA